MPDSKEIISMRNAQWEKAKDEMRAFLHFFWTDYDPQNGRPISGIFEIVDKAISGCIKKIDDNLYNHPPSGFGG